MNTLPPEPAANDKISATFMKALMRYIRANTLLNGPGYKTKRGPNGTTLEIDIPKQRKESAALPWTFSCTEDPDTGERTGGWTNCKIQIGYNCSVEDKATRGEDGPRISGTDLTDDGTYYVEVDVKNETAEIKLAGSSGTPHHDLEHDKVNVYIGTVVDGEQKDGIYCIPVIPKYV